MIYLKTKDGKHLLILEPGNLMRIQRGEIATTPDSEVGVAYTPDVPWLQGEMSKYMNAGEMDTEVLDRLLQLALKRQPIATRPYHEQIDLMKDKSHES